MYKTYERRQMGLQSDTDINLVFVQKNEIMVIDGK